MFKPQSNLWPCKLHHSVTDGTGVQSLRVEAGYLWKQKKSVPRRVRIKELDTDSCGEKNSLSSAAAGEIGPVSILWKLHNAAPGCRDVESVPGEEPSGKVPRCPGPVLYKLFLLLFFPPINHNLNLLIWIDFLGLLDKMTANLAQNHMNSFS